MNHKVICLSQMNDQPASRCILMVKVYHLKEEELGIKKPISWKNVDDIYFDAVMGTRDQAQINAVTKLFLQGKYLLVAQVNTNNLNVALVQTNDMRDYWCKNMGVESFSPNCRCSNVGDILEDEIGNFYVISATGFNKLKFSRCHLPKDSKKIE